MYQAISNWRTKNYVLELGQLSYQSLDFVCLFFEWQA